MRSSIDKIQKTKADTFELNTTLSKLARKFNQSLHFKHNKLAYANYACYKLSLVSSLCLKFNSYKHAKMSANASREIG
jgi:hypothetical protein